MFARLLPRMKALWYIAFFILFAPMVMRAETGSEPNREEGFTFEGEIGASLMGFQDVLGKHYSPRGAIHPSARAGLTAQALTAPATASTTDLSSAPEQAESLSEYLMGCR